MQYSSKEIAFDNLNKLIYDTDKLCRIARFIVNKYDEFEKEVSTFIELYDNPNILKGLTSTTENNALISDKRESIESYIEYFNNLMEMFIEKNKQEMVPENDYRTLAIDIINFKVIPILEKIVKEIELCIGKISKDTDSINTPNHIQWHGKPIELIELIEALHRAEILKGIKKDNIEIFSSFFKIKINDYPQAVTKMKTRRGSPSIFLDKLKSKLLDYFQK